MSRKHWIWLTIIFALIHLSLVWIISPKTDDIIFTRFEGNPYESSTDPFLVAGYFFLFIPYLIFAFTANPVGHYPPVFFILYIGNSLVYGLFGAWLVSKLPVMRNKR